MVKILFVCSGNVGRSQMAEAYYNHFTHSHDAVSAGTKQDTPQKYPKLPYEVVALMNEEDIDVSKNKVKLVNEDMINDADKIIVMCDKNQCPGFLLKSKKAVFWEVKDPHHMPIDEMRKIRDIIKTKVLSITD